MDKHISWWVVISVSSLPGLATGIWGWYKMRQWRQEQHPDPDTVMAQRQLYADGEFRRRWLRRSPRDLNWDRLDLECGHWASHMARYPLDPDELVECHDCAREYLKGVQKGLKK
jgi:hypothetical protein